MFGCELQVTRQRKVGSRESFRKRRDPAISRHVSSTPAYVILC